MDDVQFHDLSSVERRARSASRFNSVAKEFRSLVTDGTCDEFDELGVKFVALPEDDFNFSATAHRVPLLVRYEQIIRNGTPGLAVIGAIRVYVNDPQKVDNTMIAALEFRASGEVYPQNGALDWLTLSSGYPKGIIQMKFALYLLQHVQKYLIESHSV